MEPSHPYLTPSEQRHRDAVPQHGKTEPPLRCPFGLDLSQYARSHDKYRAVQEAAK